MIPWAQPYLSQQEKEYLNVAFDSTWISGGEYVESFTREFKNIIGCEYGVTTASGTTALMLALLGAGIGGGDEVIVPAFAFMGAANMVLAVGARPVFVDVDPNTWCLDGDKIEEALTPHTKAIIPIHTYGNVCDMDTICHVAKKNNLLVIEDVAEACFSTYKGSYAGTYGDIACFSFQATKTLAMGEGGIVLTNSEALYKKISCIRNHGMDPERRYWHTEIGHNFRLPNLQAALGCAQLERKDEIIRERKRVYASYKRALENERSVSMQQLTHGVDAIMWACALRIEERTQAKERDTVIKNLFKANIETRPGFYSADCMPLYDAQAAPVAHACAETILCLPLFCELTNEQIEYITTNLIALLHKK